MRFATVAPDVVPAFRPMLKFVPFVQRTVIADCAVWSPVPGV